MPGRLARAERLGRIVIRLLGVHQLNHLVRFEPVLDLALAGQGGRLLDVGSGSAGLTKLLGARWQATALDVEFEEGGRPRGREGSRIVGDVRDLPIVDRAFDVVAAVDLLEHVRSVDRRRAVAELCRVARRQVIIACPTGSEALAADRRLANRLRPKGRRCPEWLDEHLERGFSEYGEIVAAAQRHGVVRAWGHESIAAHERLIRAELSPLGVVPTRLISTLLGLALRGSRAWPRRLARLLLSRIRGRDRPPTYRTIVCVAVAGDPGVGAGGSTPSGLARHRGRQTKE